MLVVIDLNSELESLSRKGIGVAIHGNNNRFLSVLENLSYLGTEPGPQCLQQTALTTTPPRLANISLFTLSGSKTCPKIVTGTNFSFSFDKGYCDLFLGCF